MTSPTSDSKPNDFLQEEQVSTSPAGMLLRNRTWQDEEKGRFLGDRDPLLYDKNLEGVPFIPASMPNFKTIDGKYGQRDVAFILVKVFDPSTEDTSEATRVMLSGAYAVNQLKRMTRGEFLGSFIFTMARNNALPKLPSGQYPLMLAVWREDDEVIGEASGEDGELWPFGDEKPQAKPVGRGRPRTR